MLTPEIRLFMSLGVHWHTCLFPFLEALLHFDPLFDFIINDGQPPVMNMVSSEAARPAWPRPGQYDFFDATLEVLP